MYPVSEDKMSAFDQAVLSDLSRLEAIRANHSSASIANARASIARETKIAPGTLENIRRKRTKGVRGWIAETIRAALLRELQREITRLNHEFKMLVASGAGHRDCEMEQVAADLARVKLSLDAVKQ